MKALALSCLLVGICPAAIPIQKRISAEALTELQAANPISRLEKPKPGEAKVHRPGNQSILRDSTILHDGKNWTIVPVGSVVFIPGNFNQRVNAKPTGKLLAWNDFLTANHAWITTCEVDFKQAAGEKMYPAEHAAGWPKHNKVVVAVHQHGPISARLKTN